MEAARKTDRKKKKGHKKRGPLGAFAAGREWKVTSGPPKEPQLRREGGGGYIDQVTWGCTHPQLSDQTESSHDGTTLRLFRRTDSGDVGVHLYT